MNGRRAGSVGQLGVLSFGGSKLLTAGRGGAVLTNDAKQAQRIRLYTQRGNDAYPLSEMQAAVLLPQLRQLDVRNARRRESIELLDQGLASTEMIRLVRDDHLDAETVYYKAAFLLTDADSAARDRYSRHVRGFTIPLDDGFPALHLIHAKTRFRAVGNLQNATELHSQLLTLHHPVLLAGEGEIRRLSALLSTLRFPEGHDD